MVDPFGLCVGHSRTALGVDGVGAGAEGGKQDISAGKCDVLHHHDAVQRVDPAKSRLRPVGYGNGAAVEHQTGEDAEDGKRPGSDFGLETSENGKTGNEFEQACAVAAGRPAPVIMPAVPAGSTSLLKPEVMKMKESRIRAMRTRTFWLLDMDISGK